MKEEKLKSDQTATNGFNSKMKKCVIMNASKMQKIWIDPVINKSFYNMHGKAKSARKIP